jgi:hypothetical protein
MKKGPEIVKDNKGKVLWKCFMKKTLM